MNKLKVVLLTILLTSAANAELGPKARNLAVSSGAMLGIYDYCGWDILELRRDWMRWAANLWDSTDLSDFVVTHIGAHEQGKEIGPRFLNETCEDIYPRYKEDLKNMQAVQ